MRAQVIGCARGGTLVETITAFCTPIDPFFRSFFPSFLGGEDPTYSNHWPMPWKVLPNQFDKCCLRLFEFIRGVSVEAVHS